MFDGIVVPHIEQSFFLAELPHLFVQFGPVTAVFFVVDGVVQRHQIRMFFRDVVQNNLLVAATEVQVFQPDQIALVLSTPDDGWQVGDAGEDGGDKAGGAHPASWNAFMAASRRSMLTAQSISFLKSSSSVLMDQDTRALGKVLIRSRSRSTRSLLVAMLMVQPLPCICSSRARVRQAVFSSG